MSMIKPGSLLGLPLLRAPKAQREGSQTCNVWERASITNRALKERQNSSARVFNAENLLTVCPRRCTSGYLLHAARAAQKQFPKQVLMFFSRSHHSVIALLAALTLQFISACSSKPTGPLAYVSNERDGTITVIDTGTDSVVDTIKVGGRARGIRISPDGRWVYVALSTPSGQDYNEADNKIAAIDVESRKVVAKYDVGSDPEQLAVSPDGKLLYASNENVGTASVTDIQTGRLVSTLTVGIEPEGVTVSPDGRWVYVTAETSNSVSVIDTEKNQVVTTFLVGARPRDTAFSPDGSRAFVSAEVGTNLSVVDTATRQVIKTIEIPRGDGVKPMGVAVSKDGRKVYVANGRAGTVSVIDAKTYEIITTIVVGKRTWGLGLTPDGKKLYAANGLSNDVSVIDTSTDKVVATIKAGDGPWGVAIGH
jgi:PQQ-dependent catabolism-associated beta-propeller protein